MHHPSLLLNKPSFATPCTAGSATVELGINSLKLMGMYPRGYCYNKGQNTSSLSQVEFILSYSLVSASTAWGCYVAPVFKTPALSILLLCYSHMLLPFLWFEVAISAL